MASKKRQQTFAKMSREQTIRERRERKQEKKRAARNAKAAETPPAPAKLENTNNPAPPASPPRQRDRPATDDPRAAPPQPN